MSLNLFEEIKIAFVLTVIIIGGIILFYIFFHLLFYINSFQLIGDLLVVKVIEISFLMIFIMVIISSILSSFSILFVSDELGVLFSLPIKQERIFFIKLIETLINSSWMLVIAFIPFIIALTALKEQGIVFIFVNLLSLLPLLVTASSIGSMIVMFLMRFIPKKIVRDIIVTMLIIIGCIGYITIRSLEPEKLSDPLVFQEALHYIAYLSTPITRILPSWFSANLIISYLYNKKVELWTSLMGAYLIMFISFLLSIKVSRWIYNRGWTESNIAQIIPKNIKLKTSTQFVRLLKNEISFFSRDSNQFIQLIMIAALASVYIFTVFKVPLSIEEQFNVNPIFLRKTVALLNILGIGVIINAVCLRLFYPAISIEGKNLWLLLSCPINSNTIVKSKFLFGLSITSLLTMILIIVSNLVLKVDVNIYIFAILVLLPLVSTFVSLALYIGSVFPNFKYENITQLQTSFGGLFYIILSMFFIIISTLILLNPAKQLVALQDERFIFTVAFSRNLFFYILLSLLLTIHNLKMCTKKIKRYEVIC